jgi:hypothetical protein
VADPALAIVLALRIIGDDETVARVAINTTAAKLTLFAISAAFMSVTGAVMAPRWTYIDPAIAFNPLISFQVVIMALLGGADKLWGPLLGGPAGSFEDQRQLPQPLRHRPRPGLHRHRLLSPGGVAGSRPWRAAPYACRRARPAAATSPARRCWRSETSGRPSAAGGGRR